MKRFKLILLLLWLLIPYYSATDDYGDLVISNLDETRSRLLMVDGNMYFHAGKSKNITFRVSDGASILFGKTDILTLPNSTQIEELKNLVNRHLQNIDSWHSMFSDLSTQVSDAKVETMHIVNEIKLLKQNITSLVKTRKGNGRANARLRKLLNLVNENIVKVVKMIQTDECLHQPCQNGGTCIDLVSKFQCLCPSHFEGKTCDSRIDECELYAGSHLGCQNNATCTNNGNLTGFTCHCPKGFHGRRCHLQSTSCENSLDLCGEHGHCIPNGQNSYKCFCEFGYKSDDDPENPTCVDIDECAGSPCYPGAGCVNLPGGFKCTSCPAGLQGNGVHCADVDECQEDFANECSKNPKVECLNTFGSYRCGSCPPGYSGDGRVCTKAEETCDDSPCHPNAICEMNPELKCTCEEGWEGDGRGPNGCKKAPTTEELSCSIEGCKNGGTCIVSEANETKSYCKCAYGFMGTHCEKFNVCVHDPCGEYGKCLDYNGIRKCDCKPGYYGIFCQYQESTCGFHTNNETGVIEYQRNNKFVELRDSVCQWTIQLFDTRQIIEFRFENFSIPSLYSLTSKGCRYGFANLTIHDGPTTDRPLIGGFCHGDNNVPDINAPFYTSGNAAKLLFHIRLHSGSTYLKMSWKAIQPRCGGRITQSSGTINYFDIHDDDICAWYISVPPQYHIELTLKSVKMGTGSSVNCTVNSLELFDHQSASNRTRLIEICESQPKPLVFRTTVPFATVYFRTDRKLMDPEAPIIDCKKDTMNPWCGVGFVLSYRTIELPRGCGGTIQPDANGKMEGYIESPGYGHSYFPNLNCLWVLNATIENDTIAEAESARKVQIEFTDFDIATSEMRYAGALTRLNNRVIQNCGGDYLRVTPRGGMFCNLLPPKGVYSSPYFEIKLSTDSTVSGRGFRLKYQSVCEMDFTAKNGTIASPNYPRASDIPFKCTYRIIAGTRQAIKVTFRHIGLKTDVNTCFYSSIKQKESQDYIELKGGHKSNEQINRRYVCARYPFVSPHGEIITSGIVPLSITYSTSGDSLTNTGFAFDYEVFDVGCGGLFHQSTGVITSPNYPQRYHPHMYCLYEIMVPWNQRIRLTFDVFDVENVANQDNCGFDNVQVYDGLYVDEDDHGELLGRFCGMSKPPALISKGNKMSLVFLSDRSVNGAGFSANYRAVSAADDCDETFTNEEGIIEFNSTLHTRATTCNYVIMLPKMHRIMLSFENLTLPCSDGSLILRNGMNEDAPAFSGVNDLCDTAQLPKLITQGNRAFLRFTTNSPETTYFRVKYEQFAAGCGGKITGISGFVSAPQYPLKDSRSLRCRWEVTVGAGNRVKLSFSFIDNLDSAGTRGECNTFGSNYIDVSEGLYADDQLIKRYCTQQVNTEAIISATNQLNIRYIQHGGSYHGALYGFLAHFESYCKDIVLTDHHGSIQSPGFPGPVDIKSQVECKWTIRTTPGSRIALRFHSFNVKTSRFAMICTNYLKIPQSQVLNATSTGVPPTVITTKFCEHYIPQEIISKNNTITLEYSHFNPPPDTKFWLSWTTIGCGGIILKNNSDMYVNAHDFISDVSEDRECQWQIRAPIGFVPKISIELGYFIGDVNQREACDDPTTTKYPDSHDGIEFYAGRDNSSGIPQKILCGVLKNVTYIGQTNELYAFMRLAKQNVMQDSDGNILKAKVEFVKLNISDNANCGGVIELDDDKPVMIHSPNYPKPYPKGISCIWEFRAPNGSAVAFNITEFNNSAGTKRHSYRYSFGGAEANENCTSSMAYIEGSLAFYEGPYNASESLIRHNKMIYRVCLQLDEPQVIKTTSQQASVIFHGSPQEMTTSGEDKTQKSNGFVIKAWAHCGGKLTATLETQSFIIANGNGGDAFPRALKYQCDYQFLKDPENEDDNDKLYIRGERLPYSDVSPRTNTLNTFTLKCNDEEDDTHVDFMQELALEKDFGSCDGVISLTSSLTRLSGRYLISYGLENQFCGGVITQYERHIKFKIDKRKAIDCEWEFQAPPGFVVTLTLAPVNLPESDLCEASFIEYKTLNNDSQRICRSPEANEYTLKSPNIKVRLRYHPDEDIDDNELDNIMGDYTLKMKSKIDVDFYPAPGVIESPPPQVSTKILMYWMLKTNQNNTKIKVTFDRLNMSPYSTALLTLTPTCLSEIGCDKVTVEGYIEEGMDPRIYYFDAEQVQVEYGKLGATGTFRLKWEIIGEQEYDKYIADGKATAENSIEFTCGGELYPTYDPQILENPKNSYGKYDNDLRCKWTINRKRYSNVIIKITNLDLEIQSECQYDFLGLSVVDYSAPQVLASEPGIMSYCKNSTDAGIDLEYHQNVYLYFITDRSRTATGFRLEYRLGCRSFDYIPDKGVPLKAVITSPNYPHNYRKNESCFWGVILGSTRQMKVQAELDIDGTDGSCGGDWFLIDDLPTILAGSGVIGGRQVKRCGQISFEKTFNGRIYAYFITDNSATDKSGFKLTIEEKVIDCSSTSLWVDEMNPIRVLSSPEFPNMAPNSLNCHWVIHTLPGHRVKFTVDPHTFSLQNDNEEECTDDYLEIRDGPSDSSPLIGRYCQFEAPSTIFSTDSSLFVKFVTDFDAKSPGFNATYEVASCGGSVVLREGVNTSITSPNYPEPYPETSTCSWTVKAPKGHFVEAKVDHLWMNYSENCTLEYLLLKDKNSSGEVLMPPACSKLHTSDDGYQSMHNSMYVEFKSNSSGIRMNRMYCSNRQCGFDLELGSSPFECGGEISNDEGSITIPGYPTRIIPHLSCEWTFSAGMGNRYVLQFSFLNKENGYYLNSFKDHCYPDLEIFNGPPNIRDNLMSIDKRFCQNQTTFISMADLMTLTYQDLSRDVVIRDPRQRNVMEERLSKPWKITYKKVSDKYNREGCSFVIERNMVMRIGNLSIERGQSYGLGARSFCHLQVKRNSMTTGTTVIRFTDMKVRNSVFRNCGQGNRVIVSDTSIGPWSVNEVVCNVSKNHNETEFILPNPIIDVYLINNPHRLFIDTPLEFKLHVKFNPCGETIIEDESEDQSGVITSPNFDSQSVYNKNDYCIWYIVASEGKTVKLEMDFMDIETHVECSHDVLIAAEGSDLNSPILRYCYSSNDEIPERFRVIRSRSRDITLLWKTDNNIQRKGFNLTYSFVHYHSDQDSGCGFSSHALTGTIESPNYPKDYPNNVQCIWDVVVPYGYHVKLYYEKFDVQLSRDCDKDFLLVSQEHQSRALAPLGDYYFYFEHEDKLGTQCGTDLPGNFTAESNHIRLNFTTDASITGKGFKVHWTAECGTTMTLTHGVITSPHYPKYYPNQDFECNYLIYPILPNNGVPIVVLKVLDFDLSSGAMPWRRPSLLPADSSEIALEFARIKCIRDWLEIIDVTFNRTVAIYCQENMQTALESPPISIKGGIGVKFVGNQSWFEGSEFKRHRGFKLSYALADCGGEINLAETRDRISSTITSPGFPLPYHHNLDCVWNITAPEDRVISAKFTNVEMELNYNLCNFDFVELYDGIETNFSSITPNNTRGLMGRYCGDATPRDYLITSGPNMTVRFKSDHSSSKGGFKLIVTATMGPKSGCGGNLTATEDWATLSPPLDSHGKYYNGLRCLWNIKTNNIKSIVEFKFTRLNIEKRRRMEINSSSCYDFVAIYDGPRAISSFLLPPTCEFDEMPVMFQSSSRLADFYFESDAADGFDGFSVDYRAVTADCGGTFAAAAKSSEYAFESDRGLTRTNQKHQRCRFFFYAKEGQPLEIEFKDFSFPSDDPTCPFEFIEIRDVGTPSECTHPACATDAKTPANIRYCRKNMPARFVSQTSVVQITTSMLIQSEYKSSFRLSYKLLDQCNRSVSFEAGSHFASGRLTSPNYPNSYDNNATCTTSIEAPQNYQILIVFKEFRVERGEGFRHRYPGFRGGLAWRRGGWNPDRFGLGVDRSSPNFGQYFYSSICSYDSLTIMLNPDNTSENQTFCGFTIPPSQLSTSNKLDLKFKTDDSMAHGGYDLSYYSGRRIEVTTANVEKAIYSFEASYEKSGALTPIGFPSAYPNNTIQRWGIRPPPGLWCQFKLITFSMTNLLDVDNCEAADQLKYKIVEASEELEDEQFTQGEWFLPCVVGELEFEFPKTKGSNYYFIFSADSDNSNNGLGFRIHWDCEDYSEEII